MMYPLSVRKERRGRRRKPTTTTTPPHARAGRARYFSLSIHKAAEGSATVNLCIGMQYKRIRY